MIGRRAWAWAVFAIWLVLFAGAFAAFALTPPTGDGFVRGMNRVGAFLGWQLAATVAAAVSFALVRGCPRPRGRWIGIACYGPVALSASLWLIVAAIVAYLTYSA